MHVTPVRRFVLTFVTLFACIVLVSLLVIQARYVEATLGMVPITTVPQADIKTPPMHADGSIDAAYCSEAVTTSGFENLSGRTSTTISLDDTWFSHDSYRYQHHLATTCAVLAAVCNSESQYYSKVEGSQPYAEQTLGALGFDNIHTESYAFRSSLLDEMGAFLTGSYDIAAYTLASKTIPGTGTAPPTTLVFVGIRGSYGVEWLSNFNLGSGSDANPDHQGFRTAENEVQQALTTYLHAVGANPKHTRILITGHSRGGAIANLLAANLDDLSGTGDQLAPASGIYTYTFATPGTTRATGQHDARYGNVFNIVNDADIVPQMFSLWGYGRYGTTVTLPSVSGNDFDGPYENMCTAFEQNTGIVPSANENALASLDTFKERALREMPTSATYSDPMNFVAAARALFGIDFVTALTSHYPDTYIAWMQSVPKGLLSFGVPLHLSS